MARYAFSLQRTPSSPTIDVGSVVTAAALVRRFKLYDLILGSEQTPADNVFLFTITRKTGLATLGTLVTGVPLDAGDAIVSTLIGNQAPTVNGAGATILLSVPLNQRATFRWVAAPGGELVSSNAAANGFAVATPTAANTPSVTATFHVDEI